MQGVPNPFSVKDVAHVGERPSWASLRNDYWQTLALTDWKLPGQPVTVHINTDDDDDAKLQAAEGVWGSGKKRPGPASRENEAPVAESTLPVQPQTKRHKERSTKAENSSGAELNTGFGAGLNAGSGAGLNAGSGAGLNAGSEAGSDKGADKTSRKEAATKKSLRDAAAVASSTPSLKQCNRRASNSILKATPRKKSRSAATDGSVKSVTPTSEELNSATETDTSEELDSATETEERVRSGLQRQLAACETRLVSEKAKLKTVRTSLTSEKRLRNRNATDHAAEVRKLLADHERAHK